MIYIKKDQGHHHRHNHHHLENSGFQSERTKQLDSSFDRKKKNGDISPGNHSKRHVMEHTR